MNHHRLLTLVAATAFGMALFIEIPASEAIETSAAEAGADKKEEKTSDIQPLGEREARNAQAGAASAALEGGSGSGEEITVIGDAEDLSRIPGSGQVISEQELRRRNPSGLNEAVRLVPGLTVRAEDVLGLLPNIGVRGLNPDRSEKMHLMEDGVPASLSPYNENAAYYAPPVERMERIEVLKGSGSILYGPQTVGGVMNFITRQPYDPSGGRFRLSHGTQGYVVGDVDAGFTEGDWGFYGHGVLRKGDGFRDHSDFTMTAFTGKARWRYTDDASLTAKLYYYDAESHQTYLGLTPWMTANMGDTFNPAQYDLLEVNRTGAQATWNQKFTDKARLLVNVFGSDSTRDWNRQDFARNHDNDGNGVCAAAPGNTVATYGPGLECGDTVYMRSSFGSRDRAFEVWGIEPRFVMEHGLFGAENQLHAGVRYLYDRMTDERNNRSVLGTGPVKVSRDIRTTKAWAAFVQHKSIFWEKFGVTPGVRVEKYKQNRDMRLTGVTGDSSETVVIPGLGFTFKIRDGVDVFAGAHRGFAPPRTSEAILSSGTDAELDAEKSWNYELGIRGRTSGSAAWYEATLFMMDFSNQIVPQNQSGGASTALGNGGETIHRGLEIAGGLDLIRLLNGENGANLLLRGGYTYLETAEFDGSSIFDGNRLPYAPENTFFAALDYTHPRGFSVGIEGVRVSEQFSDPANTRGLADTTGLAGADLVAALAANSAVRSGLIGVVPSYSVVNAHAGWLFRETGVELFVNAHNLFDKRYLASRAPEGMFPGAFRQVFVGARYKF